MKEGDTIYCIKNLEYRWELECRWDLEQYTGEEMVCFHEKDTISISNIKGKEYIIDSINRKTIYVTSEDNTTPYNVYGVNEEKFNEHFIYGNEYRKYKLKKLNEIRR